jgi:CDP-paratose 2-epimerase
MKVALITGSAGLIGSEAVTYFCGHGFTVAGLDNDMRGAFFGPEASTRWNRDRLMELLGDAYHHHDIDIRDHEAVGRIFREYGSDLELIVHAAAQPSHDWSAQDPMTDFTVNANGTLVLLEQMRRWCPEAVFVFCSTNKVYGDQPNRLPLVELESRWEIERDHRYVGGIDETMSIDCSTHSPFGVSKAAADLLVQEYGRYFGLKTGVFRGGCLTGPSHSGAELHGFLSYLAKCVVTGRPYRVYGYGGKQVRDNIHSHDLVTAFFHFYRAPRKGEVYNIGGGRQSNCSVLEAIGLCQEITGLKLDWSYDDRSRSGDHVWWISGLDKFKSHYPEWNLTYSVRGILEEILAGHADRWSRDRSGAAASQQGADIPL